MQTRATLRTNPFVDLTCFDHLLADLSDLLILSCKCSSSYLL